MGRMGYSGSGGRVVAGGVLRGVLVYCGGGVGGVGGGLRNEPIFRIFRFGRISYGGGFVGLLLPEESAASFQFPKKVVEEGWHGIDDATRAAAIGLDLCLGCHRASASPTVAGEPARFRAVGREVMEGKRRNRKMFEL